MDPWKLYSLNIKVLLVKFKTLHCDCFFYDYQDEHYYGTLSFNVSHKWELIARVQIRQTKRPQSLLICSSPKTLFKSTYNCLCCLAEGRHRVCHNWQGFRKWSENVCYILVSSCGVRKGRGPLILVALVAQQTPILKSHDGTSWINEGFSADQCLLLLSVRISTEMEPCFMIK